MEEERRNMEYSSTFPSNHVFLGFSLSYLLLLPAFVYILRKITIQITLQTAFCDFCNGGTNSAKEIPVLQKRTCPRISYTI